MYLEIYATIELPNEEKRADVYCVLPMPYGVLAHQLWSNGKVNGVTVKDSHNCRARCSNCGDFHTYNLKIDSVKWTHDRFVDSRDVDAFEHCIFDEHMSYYYDENYDEDCFDDKACPYENFFSHSDFSVSHNS